VPAPALSQRRVASIAHATVTVSAAAAAVELLLGAGYVPVLTPPAVSRDGEAINVDGDKLAMQVAVALRAEILMLFSNTAGLLRDVDDPSSSVEFINVNELDKFLEMAQGRMKKKVLAAAAAVRSGVDTVVLADANRHKPVQAALDGAGTRVGGGQTMSSAANLAGSSVAEERLSVRLYNKREITLVRGEGMYLWDGEGRRYLDMMSNYGVAVLGHAHPAVTQAIREQAGLLTSAHQSFYNDQRSRFLEVTRSLAAFGACAPQLRQLRCRSE